MLFLCCLLFIRVAHTFSFGWNKEVLVLTLLVLVRRNELILQSQNNDTKYYTHRSHEITASSAAGG